MTDEATLSEIFKPRDELLASIRRKPECDILVLGGGVYAATVAHIAAFNGYKTILIEEGDYAEEPLFEVARSEATSLSKLKFLAGIRCKRALDELNTVAYHWLKKVRISELTDDKSKNRKIGWLKGKAEQFDWVINRTRLTIDRIAAARQEGAICLNYFRCDELRKQRNGRILCLCSDLKPKSEKVHYQVDAAIVINCAGARSCQAIELEIGTRRSFARESIETRVYPPSDHSYSGEVGWVCRNGSKLYAFLADDSNLFLKEEVKGDRGLLQDSAVLKNFGLEANPIPCYSSSFSRLAPRSQSRSYEWHADSNVYTLAERGALWAMEAANKVLENIARYVEIKAQQTPLTSRVLPGSRLDEEVVISFRRRAQENGISENLCRSTLRRFGSRVKYFFNEQTEEPFSAVGDVCLKGEIEITKLIEQAETIEDALLRRLQIYHLSEDEHCVVKAWFG